MPRLFSSTGFNKSSLSPCLLPRPCQIGLAKTAASKHNSSTGEQREKKSDALLVIFFSKFLKRQKLRRIFFIFKRCPIIEAEPPVLQFKHACMQHSTLGDSGAVGLGEKARRKFSSTDGRAPGYRSSPDHFQRVTRMLAPDWAQQKCFVLLCPISKQHILFDFSSLFTTALVSPCLSGSCTKESLPFYQQ